ncbi:hypothetical protein BDW74DRAFT_177858 [Aspergillus multicolor]|uniref:uncharacterized protein n=1 Tax=Aspergillus multicolor TaxID=41759 RepID=UPI003CCE2875
MSKKAEISSLNARLKAIEENDMRRREENEHIRREEIHELLGQLHILLDGGDEPEKCDLLDDLPIEHKQPPQRDDPDLGEIRAVLGANVGLVPNVAISHDAAPWGLECFELLHVSVKIYYHDETNLNECSRGTRFLYYIALKGCKTPRFHSG